MTGWAGDWAAGHGSRAAAAWRWTAAILFHVSGAFEYMASDFRELDAIGGKVRKVSQRAVLLPAHAGKRQGQEFLHQVAVVREIDPAVYFRALTENPLRPA